MGILEGDSGLKKNLEKMILELGVGESGFAFPQCLEFNLNSIPYLDTASPIHKQFNQEEGTIVYVERTGPEKDGFNVDISGAEGLYKWVRRKHVFDEDEEDLLDYDSPFVKLIYQPPKTIQDKIKEAIENEQYELIPDLEKKLNNKVTD